MTHIDRLVEVQCSDPKLFGDHIIKAACRVGTVIYTAWRHSDIIAMLHRERVAQYINQEMQGFIDNKFIFHDRYMAGKIAYAARQIPFRRMGHEMISEELWDNSGKFHIDRSKWRID